MSFEPHFGIRIQLFWLFLHSQVHCRCSSSLQVEDSPSISEETSHTHNWKRQNLFLQIPSRTSEGSSKDFVGIKMPPTPSPTPRKVNFLINPSSIDARPSGSPVPSPSSRGKSSLKRLFPKLSSFIYRSSSDVEKADNLASEELDGGLREKNTIPRSMSLTKLFTPVKRTSSLPVTPIARSNPESTHGGSITPNRIVS